MHTILIAALVLVFVSVALIRVVVQFNLWKIARANKANLWVNVAFKSADDLEKIYGPGSKRWIDLNRSAFGFLGIMIPILAGLLFIWPR